MFSYTKCTCQESFLRFKSRNIQAKDIYCTSDIFTASSTHLLNVSFGNDQLGLDSQQNTEAHSLNINLKCLLLDGSNS